MQVEQEEHSKYDEARKALKREMVAVHATALSADKINKIVQNLDHVKDVSELVWARSMRKFVVERL